jgi:hypothetical protein
MPNHRLLSSPLTAGDGERFVDDVGRGYKAQGWTQITKTPMDEGTPSPPYHCNGVLDSFSSILTWICFNDTTLDLIFIVL